MTKLEQLTAMAYQHGCRSADERVAELERQNAKLTERIKEIALDIAPDYPRIADAEPWEHLYAIESAYKGTDLANGDLHKLVDRLREKLGWTALEVVEFWEEPKAAIKAAEKGE